MRTTTGLAFIALLSLAGPAPAQSFRAAVEAFAGRPVVLDPRVAPPCPAADLAWRGEGAIVARCPGWSLVIPTGMRMAGREAPLIRRGQAVSVTARQPGFRVAIEGVAEADGRAGDVIAVRNARTRTRFHAVVEAGGTLHLPGRR